MTRLETWNKSEKEPKGFSAICTARRCWAHFLRFTPSGYYCEEHYFAPEDCIVEGCCNPMLDGEKVCREHLFKEITKEEREKILYRRAEGNMSRAQDAVLDPYDYKKQWIKENRKKRKKQKK